MCTYARRPSPSRTIESASSKSFAVSGSIVNVEQLAQVRAAFEARRRRVVWLDAAVLASLVQAAPRARSR